MRVASRLAITVALALAAIGVAAGSASAATFSNAGVIAIPVDLNPVNAVPYPSQITVSGQAAPITDVNVSLSGYSHTEALDVSVVLVGPGGQSLLLMCNVGQGGVTNVNLKLDDSVGIQLPNTTGALTSGSFKPGNHCGSLPSFPSPGPLTTYGNPGPAGPAPGATLASTFNGAGANGVWSLFVRDIVPGDGGQFAGGWSLEISPSPSPPASKKKCKKKKKKKNRSAASAKKKCKKKKAK